VSNRCRRNGRAARGERPQSGAILRETQAADLEETFVITQVRTVFLYVEDQDRALDFWTSKIGFEKRTDTEMWPGARWLEVAPPGAQTTIALAATQDFAKETAKDLAEFTFTTPSVRELYDALSAKGVEVTEPTEESWATSMRFKDPEGHEFLVAEGDE
jgi:lactoylglutathione lyase